MIEVNGIPMRGKDPKEIVKLLAGKNGVVTFKLIPAADDAPSTPLLSHRSHGYIANLPLR